MGNQSEAEEMPRARLIERLDDAEPYRAQWDALAVATRQPYGDPAWMWAWWRHAAPRGARLRTVLVLDGERLVGVAPFFADAKLGTHRFRLLGAGTSARVDVIGRPGSEREIAAAVAEALHSAQPAPDVVTFEGTPATSPWPRALADAWPSRRRPRVFRALSIPAPVLPLESHDFDSWMATKSSHFRARMRRSLRKFEERGGTFRLATGEELARDAEEFAKLHHRRWGQRGGSAVLTRGVERMLLDVARDHAADGRLRVWSLGLAGRTVSVQVFLAAGGEVTHWLGGFDDAVGNLHPGPAILSLLREIEHAYSVGDRRLDLGSGGQRYKYEFASGEETLDWISVILPTPRAPIACLQFLPLKARIAVAGRLSPRAKKRLRRLRPRPRANRISGRIRLRAYRPKLAQLAPLARWIRSVSSLHESRGFQRVRPEGFQNPVPPGKRVIPGHKSEF